MKVLINTLRPHIYTVPIIAVIVKNARQHNQSYKVPIAAIVKGIHYHRDHSYTVPIVAAIVKSTPQHTQGP